MAMGKNPSYVDTYRTMEKLVSKGKVKALGVSNFNQNEIQDLLNQCDTVSVYLYD
jgi:diketogulonate reductase-like aldo/keto reductase